MAYRKFPEYKPAAVRRMEQYITQKLLDQEPPEPKERRLSKDMQELEAWLRLGTYEQDLCIMARHGEPCQTQPSKATIICSHKERDLIPIPDRKTPELWVPMCDSCRLLKLIVLDEQPAKHHWVHDTAQRIRMGPDNVRKHFPGWAKRLEVQLDLLGRKELIQKLTANNQYIHIQVGRPMPGYPNTRVMYCDITRIREGEVIVVISTI